MIKKLQHLKKKFIDLVITETIIASDKVRGHYHS